MPEVLSTGCPFRAYKEINNPSLIESTSKAIKECQKRMKADNVISLNGFRFSHDEEDYLGGISLNELNEEISKINHQMNNTAQIDFLGLSPTDIHNIIYKPFSLQNDYFSFSCEESSIIKNTPIIEQSIFFMEELEKAGELKTTQKGNLPRDLVRKLFKKFYFDKRYIRQPNKEDDLPQSTKIKHLLDVSGFIKKRNNKLSLTKKGEKTLKKDTYIDLYKPIFENYFNKWNWAYEDGYSDFPLIQSSAIFNLLLIKKKACEWTLGEDLGEIYLRAFPALINESRTAFAPEEEVIKCFTLRFLERVCVPMGLLEMKTEGEFLERKSFFKTSDLLKKHFDFKGKN